MAGRLIAEHYFDDEGEDVIYKLNHRPRKTFNYNTPIQYSKKSNELSQDSVVFVSGNVVFVYVANITIADLPFYGLSQHCKSHVKLND